MYSDDLDSVTNNLRDSAKGSNDGYDVAFPLTKDSSKKEVEREKKRKLEESSKGKSMRLSDERLFLPREIMDAIRKSDEKMEAYSKKNRRKDVQI